MNTAENVHYLPGHEPQEPQQEARGPQVEDGYTRIANELFEVVMSAPLTLREMRVTLAILRLTYGWNRKQARVTGGLLSKLTGMPATNASRTLASLVSKNVIVRHGGSRSPVSLNKRSSEWKLDRSERSFPEPKSRECDQSEGGDSEPSQSDRFSHTEIDQNSHTSKDRKDIELPKGSSSSEKSGSSKYSFEPIDMELAEHMASHVDAITEKTGNHNLKSWANTIRLMRERDDLTPVQIRWLMDWVHQDDFWQANVLSPAKLREKQTQLIAKAKQQSRAKRTDGRKGFVQPKAQGSYGNTTNELPEWAR